MLFVLLRRHMKTILMGTIFIITPAFVMWGTGTGSGSSGSLGAAVALRINDEDVSPRDFARAVQQAERLIGPELAVSTAIDTLLDDYVVRTACRELGLTVAPAEIQAQLQQDPTFRNDDGSFNAKRWNQMVRRKDVDWAANVQRARNRLQRQQLFDLLRSSVQVSPADVRARYEFSHARRRVAYTAIDPAAFTEAVAVDDAALQAFYDERQVRYEAAATVRLGLVQWPKEPSEADEAEVTALLDTIQEQLRDGADFAELAVQYSQGPTAPKGGDLGYFTRESMVPAFAEAAFALKPGRVSAPVATQFGWHLIKVEDRRERDTGPEVRARHILIQDAPSIETLAGLFDAANTFREERGARGLAEAAAAADLTVTETEPLAQGAGTIPGVGPARDILAEAFDLAPGETTGVIDTSETFVIAEVLERRDAHLPPLAEVRSRVLTDFRLEGAGDMAAARASEVVAAARTAGDLTALAPPLAVEVTETELFTRAGFVPNLGRPPAFMEAAFRLTPGEISEPLMHGQRWLVLQVREAAPADPAEFSTEAARLRQQLEQQRRAQTLQDFLVARKAQLTAIPNPDIVAQFGGL